MSYFASSDELPAWVAALPDSWDSDWLKWSVRLSTERPSEEEQSQLPYISNEDISSWTGKLLNDHPQPTESDGRRFQVDDVLLNKLRPYLAKVYHADFDGVSSGELLCLRSSDTVLPRFLFYVLTSKGFIDSIDAETFGSKMPRADWEIVGHQPLPLPGLETQRRIAQFLDEKTARIDGLIERKCVLLDRLAEKRQALITRTVTKGLNPDAPMKPSGIDWLGDIPAHWEVKRLKFLGKTRYGLGEPPAKDDDGIPFIRATDIYRGTVDLSQVQRVDINAVPWHRKPALQAGEILVVRSGAYTGDSALVTENLAGFVAGYDMVFSADSAVSEFIAFVLLSKFMLQGQIYLARQRAAQPHLNAEELGGFITALPPLTEQPEISKYLSGEFSRQRYVEAKIEKSIDRLSEYRAALITAAVTGQIEGLQ
ncbi:MAG: restriction endonuclease subunit S [Gammaproteobacteria bacterium]